MIEEVLPACVPLVALAAVAGVAVSLGCGNGESRRAEAAAKRADADAAEARASEEAAAKREADRLADLWTYQETAAGKMHQVTAALTSTNDVDTDGAGPSPSG